jgi:hypothetical protein
MSLFQDINWEDVYFKKTDGPFIPEAVSFRSQSISVPNVPGGTEKGAGGGAAVSASPKPSNRMDQFMTGGPISSPPVGSSAEQGGVDGDDVFKDFNHAAGTPAKADGGKKKKTVASTEVIDGVRTTKPFAASSPSPSPAGDASAAALMAKQKKQEADLQDDIMAIGTMDEELENRQDDTEEGADDGDAEQGAGLDESSDSDHVPRAIEEPEIIPMRDSIFISGRNKSGAANVLPDWSFVDIAALTSAVEEGDPRAKGKK